MKYRVSAKSIAAKNGFDYREQKEKKYTMLVDRY